MTDRIYVIARASINQDGSLNEQSIQTNPQGYTTREDGISALCAMAGVVRSALLEDEDGGATTQIDGFQYTLFAHDTDTIPIH